MRATLFAGGWPIRAEVRFLATLVAAGSAAGLLLAGCDRSQPAAIKEPELQPQPEPAAIIRPAERPAASEDPAPAGESGDAAALLRRYYYLIEERRYAEAYALREPNGADLDAFAAHFDRFATQKVTVGVPSKPAEAGDWLYVEVPIQSYGNMKSGTPFGSAGTVTLRRRKPSGAWRIFTKG
jgi:hypothetical protein